jgi:Gpi18-like mannosyltransferase
VLILLLVVLVAKVAGGAYIYYSMNVQSFGTFWSDPNRVYGWEQNKVFLQHAGDAESLPFLFLGWDSAWYLSIMERSYAFSPQTYTFSPGLPAAGALFNLFVQNPLIAIAVCNFVFGLLFILLFQLLSEEYVGKRSALAAALLFGFSPYLFLFTTVVYAEGLFLFLTLCSWYLLMKGKVAGASLLAGLAALTRVMGILMVLPMLVFSLKQKRNERVRNVLLSLTPVFALAGWYLYCMFAASDFLAPIHTTEWSGLYTVPRFLLQDLPKMGINAFYAIPLQSWPAIEFWLSPAASLAALVVPPFLIYRTAKIDRSLAVYSLAGYIGVLGFGAIVSFPRFMSVLFPLWLPIVAKVTMNKREIVLIAVVSIVFFAVAVEMWKSFLNGQFVA